VNSAHQTRDRERELYAELVSAQHRRTSRIMAWLMLVQWLGAIAAALIITPRTWIGEIHRVHEHVWIAVVFGGVLASLPVLMALRWPAAASTRHCIAVSQVLFSALFIHLTGGRIETHFHVFGSLAFLAFYRDSKVLVTATVVIAADHLLRGIYFPLSVFGMASDSSWRWLEHTGWVLFEDVVLISACVQGAREFRGIAHSRAVIERGRDQTEAEVVERTADLSHTAAALRTSEGELRAAVEAAQSANLAKSEFLANMSHEIRTPMTAILGFTELLSDSAPSPQDLTDALRTIRRNGEHLLVLINDILDLSKIEAGEMRLEHIPCSLTQVCEEVYSLMQVRATQRRVALRVVCTTALPSIVSDPLRIRQVLLNLVGNALKFTQHGEVTLTVSAEPAADNPSHQRITFRIHDTGIGMTPAQLQIIGRPFAQADGSTTRRFGGTGLGLCISRCLVNMLGGSLNVESTLGQGSTFTVVICADIAPSAVQPRPAADAQAAPFSLSGRVLLAEDGPDNQRLLTLLLTRAGAEVVVAGDGRQAVEWAIASLAEGRPFPLILMDMQMPELDGYAATRLLRQKGWTGPVIALTAHAMAGDRDLCLSAGCNDYLTKPISRATLLAKCSQWIAEPPARAHAA